MKNTTKKSVRKRGFFQPVAKHEDEEQANISTRTSAKSSSVLNKKEKQKKKQQKSNLLEFSRQDANRHWMKDQAKINEKKGNYQKD
jgi:hypothetical protein